MPMTWMVKTTSRIGRRGYSGICPSASVAQTQELKAKRTEELILLLALGLRLPEAQPALRRALRLRCREDRVLRAAHSRAPRGFRYGFTHSVGY